MEFKWHLTDKILPMDGSLCIVTDDMIDMCVGIYDGEMYIKQSDGYELVFNRYTFKYWSYYEMPDLSLLESNKAQPVSESRIKYLEDEVTSITEKYEKQFKDINENIEIFRNSIIQLQKTLIKQWT